MIDNLRAVSLKTSRLLDRSFGAACRSSSFRCIIGPSGLTSYIALSPFGYEARIGGGREPNVVANVNTAQNRQLRFAESAARLRIRLLGSGDDHK